MTDDNPRPFKRARSSNALTPTPESTQKELRPLPTPLLALTLPSLLLHPPNHRHHVLSIVLSLEAVRKCLALAESLEPDIECRAWTTLAELGLIVIDGGFHQRPEHPWADAIDAEVRVLILPGVCTAHQFA
jgi:hypothetical protein